MESLWTRQVCILLLLCDIVFGAFCNCLVNLHYRILGNVYIGDANNNRIRKVTVSTGIISTIAGTGASSYSGDNGPATSATLKYPCGVALDSAGRFNSV